MPIYIKIKNLSLPKDSCSNDACNNDRSAFKKKLEKQFNKYNVKVYADAGVVTFQEKLAATILAENLNFEAIKKYFNEKFSFTQSQLKKLDPADPTDREIINKLGLGTPNKINPWQITRSIIAFSLFLFNFLLIPVILPLLLPLLPFSLPIFWAIVTGINLMVALFCAWPLLKKTGYNLRNKKFLTMEGLLSFATIIALVSSAVCMNAFPHLQLNFFDAGFMILGFDLVGRTLIEKTRNKLLIDQQKQKILPEEFDVVTSRKFDAKITPTKLEGLAKLKKGNYLIIKAGQMLPVACQLRKIEKDESQAQEQVVFSPEFLNGETIPIIYPLTDKNDKKKIIPAGLILKQGRIIVKVYSPDKSIDKSIENLFKPIERPKSSLQKVIDVTLKAFFPMSIGFAVIAFAAWFVFNPATAIIAAISIMAMLCPCAIGSIIPIATHTGKKKAKKRDIDFYNSHGISTLGKVTTIFIDKTGTLTKGNCMAKGLFDEKNKTITCKHRSSLYYKYFAALEKSVDHPIALGLINHARRNHWLHALPTITNKKKHSYGISGQLEDDTQLLAGSLKFLSEYSIDCSEYEKIVTNYENEGYQLCFLAIKDQKDSAYKIKCYTVLEDKIRPDAASTIQELKSKGITVKLLTGGSLTSAHYIASEVGINYIHAKSSAEDKRKIVEDEQKQGAIVAMIGDGVNDSLAIKQANVGIAMSTGHELSTRSADICLRGHSLAQILQALEISKKTLRNIKWGLGFAFTYSLCMLPLAAQVLDLIFVGFSLPMPALVGLTVLEVLIVFVVQITLKKSSIESDKLITKTPLASEEHSHHEHKRHCEETPLPEENSSTFKPLHSDTDTTSSEEEPDLPNTLAHST